MSSVPLKKFYGLLYVTERKNLGSINNAINEFVVVSFTPDDLDKVDQKAADFIGKASLHYVISSIGAHFLHKAAPDVSERINRGLQTTDFITVGEEVLVLLGKRGYPDHQIVKAINEFKEKLNAD
jgi:hypothetical protein